MNKLLFLILILFVTSCSSSKIVKLAIQGNLSEENFNVQTPFYYVDNYMYIDVIINQKSYTFLFDTGWDITHIDKSLLNELNFSPLKRHKVSGGSFEEVRLQYGEMNNSLTIGNIAFRNIGIGVQDMSFLESNFKDQRKIYGIVGTNILRKAFWQIDYGKQVLKFSNKIESFPPDSNAFEINMIPKSASNWGLNRIKVTINGLTDNFIFDTGSYGSFSANDQFLERLENADNFFVEITDTSESKKRKFKISELNVDSFKFKNQVVQIEKGIDLLLGNDFLEEFIVTIDWVNDKLYLQKE